ncbi:unnamed protein product [Cyprideis torosa]|uniref:Uncharacterized protein n=1 Tax=Cyprideis torosa TaxID=163714 RepID=A0A7R8ZNJ2_9CRUS|nr:unnamed protein product [Cyprideis torosa]CAG0898115.1 unnamed protein product [Cyprideis torosa]
MGREGFRNGSRRVPKWVAKGSEMDRGLGRKKAEEAFMLAEKLGPQSRLAQRVLEQSQSHHKLVNKLEDLRADSYWDYAVPEVVGGAHKKMPSVSRYLKLLHKGVKGRHMVAAKDLKPGQVVMVEKPLMTIFMASKRWDFCLNCVHRIQVPVPCKRCDEIAFCSAECRDEAESFHKQECGLLQNLDDTCHQRIRMAILYGLNALKDPNDTVAPDDLSNPTDPRHMNNLLGHDEHRSAASNFSQALESIFCLKWSVCGREGVRLSLMTSLLTRALKVLQLCGFFAANPCSMEDRIADQTADQTKNRSADRMKDQTADQTKNRSADRIKGQNADRSADQTAVVCSRLMDIFQKCWVNSFTVSHYRPDTGLSEDIGSAVYSTISLINHSCIPNCAWVFNGNVNIVRTLKSIRAGEEIRTSYNSFCTYFDTPADKRRTRYRGSYFFDCDCEACEKGWGPETEHRSFPSSGNKSFRRACLKTAAVAQATKEYRSEIERLLHFQIAHMDEMADTTSSLKTDKKPCIEYELCVRAAHTCNWMKRDWSRFSNPSDRQGRK